MKTNPILSRTIASILILAPISAVAASNTISGANPAWATTTNWSLGALPTAADNVIITATGAVDIRGSTLGGLAEIQDLTFSSAAAMTLENNSTSADMLLALNGTRGPGVPLIATTGNFTYTVAATGTGTHLLTMQLNAGGTIDVAGSGRLDLGPALNENGGLFALTKTGNGVLSLGSANVISGGFTVNGGSLELWNASSAGTGPISLASGTRLTLRNISISNPVTVAGAELATRSGDLSSFDGPVHITANSTAVLRSFTTPANDQDITINGQLSGAVTLTVLGNASNATSGKALILTNPLNDFSGTFVVAANQRLRSASISSSGSALGTAGVTLNGGTLQVRDDAGAGGTTVIYNNNVTVGAGGGVIDVDPAFSINTDNTIQFGTLTIDGQTLTTSSTSNYSVSFSGPVTLTGNATFNTAGASLRFSSAIGGAFGITKSGVSTTTLAGTNTYTGPTNINAGTLTLTGSITTSSQINVADAGNFDVTGVFGGFVLGGTQSLSGAGVVTGPVTVANNGTVNATGGSATSLGLNFSQLTLGQSAGNIANLRVTLNANPGKIIVTAPGGLTLAGGPGSAKLNVNGITIAVGTYTLVDYDGTIGGAGFAGFALGSLPVRTIATLVNNVANTSVDLNVTGADFPVWTGAVSSEWSTVTIASPKNWRENNSGNNTDFINGDRILFNDTGTRSDVDVSVADVSVTNLTFNHSARNYSIAGSKSIVGTAGLTKLGTGTLTIGNVNGFTGPVSIGGGVISIATIADAGVPSPLGASSTISIDGGTLRFTGTTGVTNRVITAETNGATIQADGTLTLSAGIAGTGNLTKTGTGTLVLAGTTNAHTDTTIVSGVLQVGDGTANAGAPGIGLITNQGELIFDHSNNLTITNTIEGTGKLQKRGTGTVTLGGPAPNTFSGGTTIRGGVLVAGKLQGIDAVGDLTIEVGGAFQYLTNNVSNQILDSATVTLNGGIFGDPANAAPTNPGATDTIANLTVNSGTFGSGRNITIAPFTVTNVLKVNGGVALAQRGGAIFAQTVEIGAGSINLDGGSATAGQESRLDVGSGGLKLTSGTINFNSGPSAVAAASMGSIVNLNGNITSTGTSKFTRLNAAELAPKAHVDLGGTDRTFDVTGTLEIGAPGAHVDIVNGGLTKTGSGSLVLGGDNTYVGETKINTGTLVLTGTLSGTLTIHVAAGAKLDGSNAAGGFSLNGFQTLSGDGTIDGNVLGNGTISPGTNGFGTLHFGGSLTLAGVSNHEIGLIGPGILSDVLDVAGNLTYGGTLAVTATGQPLHDGAVFNLFDAQTFSGSFLGFNLPALDPGLFWDTSKLTMDGTIAVVPEPGSGAVLTAGLAWSLGGIRRRRKAGSCKAPR